MLFITNRLPTKNTEPAFNTKFEFDLKNNSSGHSFFCCRRDKKGLIEEIGSMNLLSEIKSSKYRQVLLYLHGFSNMPEDVFANAEEFQMLCDKKKAGEILVIPVIWPCDKDLGVIKDYWDDQKAADQSAFSLARMLQKFMEWRSKAEFNTEEDPCLKRINMLSHSMGNRVLRQTLSNWRKYDQPNGLPLLFRNTFLVAADILNESLHKGEEGELISHASRNVVVYYASDDLALRASKISNLKNAEASRRLGHSGPEDMERTPKNVYAIDCDEVNTLYDPPKGHSYFRSGKKKGDPGVVFDHIFETMITGRVFPSDEYRKSSILALPKLKK
jgi:esterase/lipase superfamily enzyme